MIVDTEAIVLQVRKFSDSSKIVVLFTKEFGKISVLAKGAFSSKSKFGGGLEPLSYIRITFYRKPLSGLHLLKSTELICTLNNISKCYNALIAGLVAAEFISTTQKENFDNTELFNSFVDFLQEININIQLAFPLCVRFLLFVSDNMGFSIVGYQAHQNTQITHFTGEYKNYAILQQWIGIFDNVLNVAQSNDFNDNNYIELFIQSINYFSNFYSENLGKRISIKSIKLLND